MGTYAGEENVFYTLSRIVLTYTLRIITNVVKNKSEDDDEKNVFICLFVREIHDKKKDLSTVVSLFLTYFKRKRPHENKTKI